MNFKLTLQYDGTDFHGWQMQGDLRTVQGELTRALSLIEGREVVVHGSGRTDAGVHAEGQVASVVLSRDITPEKLRAAINGNVGRDVRVINVEIASEYRYRDSVPNPNALVVTISQSGETADTLAALKAETSAGRS